MISYDKIPQPPRYVDTLLTYGGGDKDDQPKPPKLAGKAEKTSAPTVSPVDDESSAASYFGKLLISRWRYLSSGNNPSSPISCCFSSISAIISSFRKKALTPDTLS